MGHFAVGTNMFSGSFASLPGVIWLSTCFSLCNGSLRVISVDLQSEPSCQGDGCLLAAMFSGTLRVFSLPSHQEQAEVFSGP